jgi:hypothetical protein
MTRLENSVAALSTTNNKSWHNKKNSLSLLAAFRSFTNRLCAIYESPCTLVIRFRVCRGVEIITFQAWLSSTERNSAMHGPLHRSFFEGTSSGESARLRRGFGIGPFQPWMEMLISKVATDFKVIRSECEMIQSSTRGLEVWFGRGTVREVIRERRTGF